MSHSKFHKNQIDFISLKINITDSTPINMENLQEHPVLRNQYILDSRFGEHAKNFSLYFQKKDYIILKLSVPYFLFGHNYKRLDEEGLEQFSEKIKEILNINILEATILEFEYGAFERIDLDSKQYIKNILGLKSWDLEYNKTYMKMFCNHNKSMHYKIYDAVANAKSKGTYKKCFLPADNIIKHEIKFTNVKNCFGKNLLFRDLLFNDRIDTEEPLICTCIGLLENLRKSLVEQIEFKFTPIKSDLTHVLYTALKNQERSENQETTIYSQLLQLIDTMNLSSSQRSKRKKSIELLEELYCITPF